MRPWTDALSAAYPTRPVPREEWGRREYARVVPDRPWWRFPDIVRSAAGEVHYHKDVAVRSDGARIVQVDRRQLIAQGLVGICHMTRTVSKGGSWQAERLLLANEIDQTMPIPHPGFRVGQIWASADASQVWQITRNDDIVRALDLPFLVADAACPWLAPWSAALVR